MKVYLEKLNCITNLKKKFFMHNILGFLTFDLDKI